MTAEAEQGEGDQGIGGLEPAVAWCHEQADFPFAPVAAVKYMRKEYEAMRLPPSLRAGIDRRNAEALLPRLKKNR